MVRKNLIRDSKYRLLFITTLGFVFLSPFTSYLVLGKWIYALLFLFVMIAVSINIKTPKHANWILPTLGGITIITNLANDTLPMLLVEKSSMLIFFIYAIFLFGKNVFTDRRHSIDHIYGSICIYLLIGIAYATVYTIIHILDAPSLIYQQSGIPVSSQFDFYYFSFITLTTVGYGDIIANHDLAKAFIILESITGLFYLAVLVASLISIMKTTNIK